MFRGSGIGWRPSEEIGGSPSLLSSVPDDVLTLSFNPQILPQIHILVSQLPQAQGLIPDVPKVNKEDALLIL